MPNTGRKPPNAGKGRPKGSPNKLTRDLKEMILGALDKAGGVAYLTERAKDTPGPFLALVGKVLPLTLAGDKDAPLLVGTLTDDELRARLDAAREALR